MRIHLVGDLFRHAFLFASQAEAHARAPVLRPLHPIHPVRQQQQEPLALHPHPSSDQASHHALPCQRSTPPRHYTCISAGRLCVKHLCFFAYQAVCKRAC